MQFRSMHGSHPLLISGMAGCIKTFTLALLCFLLSWWRIQSLLPRMTCAEIRVRATGSLNGAYVSGMWGMFRGCVSGGCFGGCFGSFCSKLLLVWVPVLRMFQDIGFGVCSAQHCPTELLIHLGPHKTA